MSNPVKILAFAGSNRRGSFNAAALAVAVEGARTAGAVVTVLSLRDYPLPLFDQDVESEGTPERATALKAVFMDHDALLIAAPEYNSSITPLLKNAIDWVSRPAPGGPGLVAFEGKVAGLIAASPGALGGLRGLVHLRAILGNIGVTVIPEQYALGSAHSAFDESGRIKDAKAESALRNVGKRLAEVTARLRA